MNKKGPLRNILLMISVASFLAAIGCAIGAAYIGPTSDDPMAAALMASVVFFVGVGVVVWVIARADLPDMRFKR